jgi:cytochrome c553
MAKRALSPQAQDLLDQFLDWTRHQPCCTCGAWPSDPAHVLARGSRNRRFHLGNVIPLCRSCHDRQHAGTLDLPRLDAQHRAQQHLLHWLTTSPQPLPF